MIYEAKQNKMADQLIILSSDQNVFFIKQLHNRLIQ